jgi:hypothetical protein
VPVKVSHFLIVGAVAVAAISALVTIVVVGRGANMLEEPER